MIYLIYWNFTQSHIIHFLNSGFIKLITFRSHQLSFHDLAVQMRPGCGIHRSESTEPGRRHDQSDVLRSPAQVIQQKVPGAVPAVQWLNWNKVIQCWRKTTPKCQTTAISWTPVTQRTVHCWTPPSKISSCPAPSQRMAASLGLKCSVPELFFFELNIPVSQNLQWKWAKFSEIWVRGLGKHKKMV